MIYSKDRIKATPGAVGTCEVCGSEVIAKCGDIKIWHWAHKNITDCDSWGEPMTQWHLDWQNLVSKDRQEVTIGKHRADAILPDGTIMEVQHSSISHNDIIAREYYYDNMIWIIDGRDVYADGRLYVTRDFVRDGEEYLDFWWKYRKFYSWFFDKQVYIELDDDDIVRVDSMLDDRTNNDRLKFRGVPLSREELVNHYSSNVVPVETVKQKIVTRYERDRTAAYGENADLLDKAIAGYEKEKQAYGSVVSVSCFLFRNRILHLENLFYIKYLNI